MYQGSTDNYQRLFTEHSNNDTDTKSIVRNLQARVDKLELVCEALWEIVREKEKLDDVDLVERVTQIDLRDGIYDGKKKKTSVVECIRCKRKNSKRHTRCMYCGEVFVLSPFE